MRTRRLVAAASALALGLGTAAFTDGAGPTGDEPHVRSSTMSWVANVQYPVSDTNTRTSRQDTQGGTDLELLTIDGRDYALAGTYENGFQVVDVTDPTQPSLAATYGCDAYQGDVQAFTREDLRTADGRARSFATFSIDYNAHLDSACFADLPDRHLFAAEDTNGDGVLVIEVTDPLRPRSVSFLPIPDGSHNLTLHPSGTVLYNSENDAGGLLEVWDVAGDALFDPVKVTEVAIPDGGTDTHDVTFDATGERAYVASINTSYVLDTTDPYAPRFLSRIVDPAIGIHHQADPVDVGDRRYLLIGDEIAGAAGNGFCPGGGIHVYDVTGPLELAPVKVGAYFMPDVTIQEGARTGTGGLVSCTAHVFRTYDTADGPVMTIGNMAGGVRVIDLSNLVGVSVGDDDTSTGGVAGMRDRGWFRFTQSSDAWSFKAHPDRIAADGSFFAFANDQTRGFEVFRFDGGEPTTLSDAEGQGAERGRWLTPQAAAEHVAGLDLDPDAVFLSCRFGSYGRVASQDALLDAFLG